MQDRWFIFYKKFLKELTSSNSDTNSLATSRSITPTTLQAKIMNRNAVMTNYNFQLNLKKGWINKFVNVNTLLTEPDQKTIKKCFSCHAELNRNHPTKKIVKNLENVETFLYSDSLQACLICSSSLIPDVSFNFSIAQTQAFNQNWSIET